MLEWRLILWSRLEKYHVFVLKRVFMFFFLSYSSFGSFICDLIFFCISLNPSSYIEECWSLSLLFEVNCYTYKNGLLAFFPQIVDAHDKQNKKTSGFFFLGKLTGSKQQHAKINRNPLLYARNNMFTTLKKTVLIWYR